VDEIKSTTGIGIKTVTADAGYAYAKVYSALERRGIDALIQAKAEPIKSRVPLRRFRYDAKHDILKCPQGRILRPARPSNTAASSIPRLRTVHVVRSSAIACRKGGSIKPSLSFMTILPCWVPDAVASDGAWKSDGSISVIAGARRAFMARPRPGMASHVACDVASRT
jgi:hypothetical protein